MHFAHTRRFSSVCKLGKANATEDHDNIFMNTWSNVSIIINVLQHK